MSFILDALKKLEQKRQHGNVPNLSTIHASVFNKHEKRPIWHYIILLALVINAIIFTIWLLRSDTGEQVSLVRPDTAKQEKARAAYPGDKSSEILSVTTTRPSDLIKSEETYSRPLELAAASIPEKTILKPVIKPIEKLQESEKIQDNAVKPESVLNEPEVRNTDNTALGINPSDQELAALRNKIKEDITNTTSVSSPKKKPAEITESTSEKRLLELSQLPDEIRQEIPEITLSGHIYSNNPSSRLANINGSMVRESDTITRGLKVEEITKSGIIFSYKGFRFQMRAF